MLGVKVNQYININVSISNSGLTDKHLTELERALSNEETNGFKYMDTFLKEVLKLIT